MAKNGGRYKNEGADQTMNILTPNLMVLASAGSGKTYQLSNRIIGFLSLGAKPESMVALTFTRKAASEFTDSLLIKLANAALSEQEAENIFQQLHAENPQLQSIVFPELLENVVRALPSMMLGTMDSFFSKIVRGFQYDLGIVSGTFQLVTGSEYELLTRDLLEQLLMQQHNDQTESFYYAFRRTMKGKEKANVMHDLESYVRKWHSLFQNAGKHISCYQPQRKVSVADWNRVRNEHCNTLLEWADHADYPHGSMKKNMLGALTKLAQHSIGSGDIGTNNILKKLCDQFQDWSSGSIPYIAYKKEFTIPEDMAFLFHETLSTAAWAEITLKSEHTQAVHEVVTSFDALCDQELRSRGCFNFDDIKSLMAAWVQSEEQRLLREALDFRLQARYMHWLLDEFQDTSRTDWAGLFPLVDDAAQDEERTLFLVGDKKQAIYGWRGGDVTIFDDIQKHYGDELQVATMPISHRSCPEVLSLVNRICGNKNVIEAMYGQALAERWQWEDHSAAKKNFHGIAKVEIHEVNQDDEVDVRLLRLLDILRESGIGQKKMSRAVLVRTNDELLKVVDFLRENGVSVVEDSVRKPAESHPVATAILYLMRWLAQPADSFARYILQMSSFTQLLEKQFPQDTWRHANDYAQRHGYAALVESITNQLELSSLAKPRVNEMLNALTNIDADATMTTAQAFHTLELLTVPQESGGSDVQVMTIHKSKGLGFDLVVLPFISNNSVPDLKNYSVAQYDDWVCEVPAEWVRKFSPDFLHAEHAWRENEKYAALCNIYVALTRAKQGLYILVNPPTEKDESSLAKFICDTCGGEILFGNTDWIEQVPPLAAAEKKPAIHLATPQAKNTHHFASQKNISSHWQALEYGTEMHAALEKITWLDEMSEHEIPPLIRPAIFSPQIRDLLEKKNRNITLFREVPVDGVIDGNRSNGIIDRLHIFYDENHQIEKIQIIDFKTGDAEKYLAAYREQLSLYQKLIAHAYSVSDSKIQKLIVLLSEGKLLEVI